MTVVAWANGRFVDPDSPMVSPLAYGLTIGQGLFETLAVYGGTPFALTEHLDRLLGSCAILGLGVPRRQILYDACLARPRPRNRQGQFTERFNRHQFLEAQRIFGHHRTQGHLLSRKRPRAPRCGSERTFGSTYPEYPRRCIRGGDLKCGLSNWGSTGNPCAFVGLPARDHQEPRARMGGSRGRADLGGASGGTHPEHCFWSPRSSARDATQRPVGQPC